MATKADLQEMYEDAERELSEAHDELAEAEKEIAEAQKQFDELELKLTNMTYELAEDVKYLLEALRGNSKAHALVAIERVERGLENRDSL